MFTGGAQYKLNFNLTQNSLMLQDYNNMRYGGKDTSGNNGGVPGGYSIGAMEKD